MKKIILAFVATVMAVGFVYSWLNSRAEQSVLSDIQLANIETLAAGEGPSTLGCKPYRDATCYVFDGNGQLVDKRKNQYPGDK